MDKKGLARFLPTFRTKKRSNGLTALALTGQGVALAHIRYARSGPVLQHCEFIASNAPLADTKAIKQRLLDLGLQGTDAVALMPHGGYQLLLVEAPEVPAEEMSEALRWRVKDLLGFDVDEAVIDYVELPDDAYRGRARMVYAVAAEKSKSLEISGWMESLDLTPVAVDIPEFTQLNVTKQLAEDETSVGFLMLGSPGSTVSLLSDHALYFTRSLSYDLQNDRVSSEQQVEALVLELQRSLDYYESQVGRSACFKLVVMPMQQSDSLLMRELQANLPLEVDTLDLSQVLESAFDLDSAIQSSCSLAIAAALRQRRGDNA